MQEHYHDVVDSEVVAIFVWLSGRTCLDPQTSVKQPIHLYLRQCQLHTVTSAIRVMSHVAPAHHMEAFRSCTVGARDGAKNSPPPLFKVTVYVLSSPS